MKITENEIIFENQREKEIFLICLREVNISVLLPEISMECETMIDNIIRELVL